MESYIALLIGLILVVVLAMALAAYNNRAEEAQPQTERQQSRGKRNRNDNKKNKKNAEVTEAPAPKAKNSDKKKKKKAGGVVPQSIKFSWDGKQENDDESMIELLKGSSTNVIREVKEDVRKKARAVTAAVGQTVEKAKGKSVKKEDDNEEFEYVLMKRKKVDENTKTKKKTAKDAVVPENATTAVEGTVLATIPAPENLLSAEGKKREKTFFKRGVFASLRQAAKDEQTLKQQEEDERNNARSKRGNKDDSKEEAPAKDERKDKPARPKRTGDDAQDDDENPAVGPRQQRPRREPREPREPREAPPPPPRPLGGYFEIPSLDDMLGAISSHFGPKPKQNFSKLPPNVLFRMLKMLSVRDIIALSQVNHFLSKVTRDDKLWRNYCEKDFTLKFPGNKGQQNNRKKFKNVYREEYITRKGKNAVAK